MTGAATAASPGDGIPAKADLLRLVRQAGVVGQGGAGFPAQVKYEAQVETVIANGCECEPLLFTDQYLMVHHAPEIVRGLAAVMAAVGARRGVIALKRKYAQAEEAFRPHLAGAGLELARLDNFYPAGDEQVLIHEITGLTVPPLGLPKEVGVLVANVGTLLSVSRALDGEPVTHKVVTVTGRVARPSLLRVPLGAAVADCLAWAGGVVGDDPVYLLGGPMMGRFVDQTQDLGREVVTKTLGGIIVLPRGHYLHEAAALPLRAMRRRAATACIQCRYCTDLCPRHLIGHGFETHQVMRAFAAGAETAPAALQAVMCSECGLCELFSCPMRLSPRRINAFLKARFREEGLRYQGPRAVKPEQALLRPFRRVPVVRLALKLGLAEELELHPEFAGERTPAIVRLPLRQHAGAPALATVKVSDRVRVGDLIGEIPQGALGARVHASLAGVVRAVDQAVVIEGA